MRTSDLLPNTNTNNVIHERCSNFISESRCHPLIKNLPDWYPDCQRVKVRQRKTKNNISSSFNEAFVAESHNLHQRSIFASSRPTPSNGTNAFYVFPIDGFKFMYSKKVHDSSVAYNQVYEALNEQLGVQSGNELLTELLRFSYTNQNLAEGITSGSEIVMYNIPFYYAVRITSVPSYGALVKINNNNNK